MCLNDERLQRSDWATPLSVFLFGVFWGADVSSLGFLALSQLSLIPDERCVRYYRLWITALTTRRAIDRNGNTKPPIRPTIHHHHAGCPFDGSLFSLTASLSSLSLPLSLLSHCLSLSDRLLVLKPGRSSDPPSVLRRHQSVSSSRTSRRRPRCY